MTDAFPRDPFKPTHRINIANHDGLPGLPGLPITDPAGPQWHSYTYTSWNSEGRTTASGTGYDIESLPRSWVLQSSGPDRLYFNTGWNPGQFHPGGVIRCRLRRHEWHRELWRSLPRRR